MEKLGRYALHGEIASGGTASVHLGHVAGPAGFQRVVAIKRLHSGLVKDPAFHAMLVDEARIAARVRHVNVVGIVDVVELDGELLLVMDYVAGETLSRLRGRSTELSAAIPPAIASAIMGDVLRGLHAAHEARGVDGGPLEIVHRDVSPQNVMVGVDGVSRVVDFGIAKATGRLQTTRDGEVKGKAAYMAPEQLRGGTVDRRSDVFAAGIILWELLTGARLFEADSPAASMMRVLERDPDPPSEHVAVPAALDAVVLSALARDPAARPATAEIMASALEDAIQAATHGEVATWVRELAGDTLEARAAEVRAIEASVATAPAVSTRDAPRRRAARGRLVAGGLAVFVVTAAAVAWRTSATRASEPRGDTEASAAVSASIPPVESSAPAPPKVEAVAASVTTAASAAVTRGTLPRRPVPAQTGSRADRCNPPYVIGPKGIHVLKTECL